MPTKTLAISLALPKDASCERCLERLRARLMQVRGVTAFEADLATAKLRLTYGPEIINAPDLERAARRAGATLTEQFAHHVLPLEGLDCPDCAAKVEKAVSRMDGVLWASVSFAASTMSVEFERGKVTLDAVAGRVRELGYAVREETSGLRTATFHLYGLDCADDVARVKKAVEALAFVASADVNLMAGKMLVRHRCADLPAAEVIRAVWGAGFQAQLEGAEDAGAAAALHWRKTACMTLSGLLLMAAWAMSLLAVPKPLFISACALAMVTGGVYFVPMGIAALRSLTLDMNFLMTLAVLGAAVIGEWLEAATVVFLFSLAQWLESRTVDRARRAIRSLMELSPFRALVKRDKGQVEAPVEEVAVGEVILIKPGDRIPLDGQVVAGTSSVNQAAITGESLPVPKKPGDEVFAGTLNDAGSLEVRVTKLSRDTTLAKIIHMVEEAQAQRAPSQAFVDRFAKYYTPAVIAIAFLIAVVPPAAGGEAFSKWFYRALVLLVISCPCALVISTPVSIVSGLAAAARSGVLIKGGVYLEDAGRVQVVAFDKTGTLTKGVAEVTDVIPLGALSPHELLSLAASIEALSEHHLAAAILAKAKTEGVSLKKAENFKALTGLGAQATMDGVKHYIGNHRLFREKGLLTPAAEQKLDKLEADEKTAVLLGTKDGPLGVIGIADRLRDVAAWTLSALRRLGVKKILMLTGDNMGTAQAIADELGIDEYYAELLPQGKAETIRELAEKGGVVAMVGDGVNDAPALASATLGIAMGTAGSDVALETADIALMADDLSKLPYVIQLGRRTLRTIRQNVAASLVIKGAFVALAIAGKATLWMAVAADMGASLLVIANGLRLLRRTS